ncbi:MAG: hypothetical protein J7K20_02230 [Thermodesulfobacterium sp.]|nr:hypothetical protein [Thermodesulfobacterium sp.]
MRNSWFKKIVILFMAFFLLSSCKNLEILKSSFYEFKEKASERIKVSLSKIPFIKEHITLPPAPEKLYIETKNLIDQLKAYKAEDMFKDEYQRVLNAWERAKKLYQNKYYKSAEKELKKVNSMAKELLENVKAYRETLKTSALKKYKKMEKIAQRVLKNVKSEKKRLEIKLYLWKLKNLIEMEEYDEFERELQNPPF